jgi:RNA polymerase sigma-70 factor (ECF subfamily)
MENDRTFTRSLTPHLGNLYGAAMRLTRDQANAEDLVQDTMVRALRFRDTFQPGANIKSWLFTILRNTFINGYHQARRRDAVLVGGARHYDAVMAQFCDESTMQDVALELDERDRLVRSALADVPDAYRGATAMAAEGSSYKEIAEAMDVPIGTVMSRVYRGRRDLVEQLDARRRRARRMERFGRSLEVAA